MPFRLGLIGDRIGPSQAPRLHRLAGRLCGLEVVYDLLVPAEQGRDFDDLFQHCATAGYRGLNITHPYKERAAAKVAIEDPRVRAIGAVNTLLFTDEGARGFNSDHSGFIAAYRETFGATPPGAVCLLGAGGAGKAVAFALIALGAEEIRLVERDRSKAEALATALRAVVPGLRVSVEDEPAAATAGATGIVNCTPIGMDGHPGRPLPPDLLAGARWAFDAVYTPLETLFLADAAAAGLKVMSGYELFFHQGLDAFEIFTGRRVDPTALRESLREGCASVQPGSL